MSAHEEVFLKARQITDAVERAAFLERVYGGDNAQRAAMEQLLRDACQADAFFGRASMSVPPCAPGDNRGSMIGRYKLLEKIGEGGMGVVFMAEQREPVLRKVALKIIKAGMDTRQVIARFEAERQALALMDHPNIARVLDGGETDSGRPYFVMDLVQGLPITRFCDEANLTTRHRLELFLDVCSAIQHAHQKGIIHRDIKPSNILVTMHGDKPVPKVIDFGIAKATQQPLTEKTLFTQFEHMLGTPAYMSPEQASLSGLDIDTRSDIYGLGVLLYELLTGTTPFDGKELLKAGLDEMRRIIREKDPPRPSTRVIRRRVALPPNLGIPGDELDPDLDWIVMKCLEKERVRRYETANGLAADIRRHLSDELVTARPPSLPYRWRKSIVRHKIVFATAAIVAGVLIVGLTVSTWLYLRERDARGRAVGAEKAQMELRRDAEAARRRAEAGQTALLYWQAFDAFPDLSDEERSRLAVPIVSDETIALAGRYDAVFTLFHRAAAIGAGCDWAVNVEDGPETWTPSFMRVREATEAACLRALVALSNKQAEEACRDLLSALVFGRHVAVDGALVSVMAQVDVESKIAQFFARNFGRFPPENLELFVDAVHKAPARIEVARGAEAEQQGATQWLIREIRKARIAANGDEMKALQRARKVLAEGVGPGAWADATIFAAGGTTSGLIAYIHEAAPYYEMVGKIALSPPDRLEADTAHVARQIETSTNLVVQRIIPNLSRARRLEMEARVRWAMFDAAVAFKRNGAAGLREVRDPFGEGPFEYHQTGASLELRSKLADYGYDGTLAFTLADRVP